MSDGAKSVEHGGWSMHDDEVCSIVIKFYHCNNRFVRCRCNRDRGENRSDCGRFSLNPSWGWTWQPPPPQKKKSRWNNKNQCDIYDLFTKKLRIIFCEYFFTTFADVSIYFYFFKFIKLVTSKTFYCSFWM